MQKIIILISIFFTSIIIVKSQDIEQVLKAKPVDISGGVNVNTGWYFVEGIESGRDPYNWGINANLNINLYDVIDVPFSLVINKGDKKLNRPQYTNIGLSPKYKQYTLHLGYRSMQFSSYTYSGITFYGVGGEISPKNSIIKNFSCFYGRFNEAVPVNFSKQDITPVYRRRGWGSKISLGKKGQNADFIIFKAIDDPETINYYVDSVDIKPQENLALGIITKNKITEKLSFHGEYTVSILSTDTRIQEKEGTENSFINETELFKPRNTTASHNAFAGGIDYQGNTYSVGLSYKRVDPEFKSLGTSYSTNDTEDWLINASKTFLDSKVNVNGSFGKQRNNLDKTKETKSIRNIYSCNVSYTPIESLNTSVNYSNFSSNTLPSVLYLNDSIKFIQTTTNKGFNVTYSFGKNNFRHYVNTSSNFQDAYTLNQTGQEKVSNESKVKSALLTYSLSVVPVAVTINTSMNYSVYDQDSINNITYGPTIGTGRPFFNKKVQMNISFSSLVQKTNNSQSSNVSVINFSCSYRFWKKHSLMLSNLISFRQQPDSVQDQENNSPNIREIRGSVRYSFSF